MMGRLYQNSGLSQDLRSAGGRLVLAVADHGHLPGNPGWLLRNSLLLAAVRFGVSELNVACVRLRRGKPSLQHSLLLSVTLPSCPDGQSARSRHANAAPVLLGRASLPGSPDGQAPCRCLVSCLKEAQLCIQAAHCF